MKNKKGAGKQKQIHSLCISEFCLIYRLVTFF